LRCSRQKAEIYHTRRRRQAQIIKQFAVIPVEGKNNSTFSVSTLKNNRVIRTRNQEAYRSYIEAVSSE
jgi:hypothetical protein